MRRSIKFAKLILAVAAALAAPAHLGAQATAPASAPATAPAGAVVLNASITSIKGVVQVRMAEDQPWQPATVGMKLGQGAELRTGLRSAVQFVIEPDQVITLDRLGTLKVIQAYLEPGKVTTDLGVKYGRTRYDIQSADLQHQSTIRSPGSTLAIRGTDVTYEDQVPWVPSAVSRTGRAQFRNYHREFIAFGGAKPAAVSADKGSAAEKAQEATSVDPHTPFSGLTLAEQQLLTEYPLVGGTDLRGFQATQRILGANFSGPVATGTVPVGGPLLFDMFWTSTLATPNPTDLDLQITDPKGRTATPLNPTIGTGTAIGMHSGDDMGLSGSGDESVSWGLFFPPGTYKVTAVHKGGDPAQIFITATQGDSGTPLKTFGVDPQPAIILQPGDTFTDTVKTQKVAPAAAAAASTARPSPRGLVAAPTAANSTTAGPRDTTDRPSVSTKPKR